MRRFLFLVCVAACFNGYVAAQNKRLWVLRSPGEMAEYDPTTFAEKRTLKVPAEALSSPRNLLVNRLGQMLFATSVSLPLAQGDLAADRKVWFWDGHTATTLTRDVGRATSTAGSNLVITESAPAPYLSADGTHLYWFSNRARRLQRDGVDLSTRNTWLGLETDLAGGSSQEMPSISLPDCPCPTGSCEETCPYGEVWVPDDGVDTFFLLTQFVAGQTDPIYKTTSRYEGSGGKWTAQPLDPPLRRVLDARNAGAVLEAIPDTGCCGWANVSDDQTRLRLPDKTVTVFDEWIAYKNPDYDVSFSTEDGKLSPDLRSVALTIVSTARPNTPIQLSEQGQANPEESRRIRKALTELPAVEVKKLEEEPRRTAFIPHASLVGWMSDREILIIEGRLLVAYDLVKGTRRNSNIRVEDAAHVFVR